MPNQDRAFYEIKYPPPVIQVLKGTGSLCYYWELLDIILRIKKGYWLALSCPHKPYSLDTKA